MKRSHALEAITVCVGYSDFLHETAKWNIPHFDEWIVVTEPQDERTREVCRKFNLKCVLSEDGRKHAKGEGWNKGRLVERGLGHTSANANRLHIDSDIALPHGFRHLVQTAELEDDFIYGADRIDVPNWESWQKLLRSGFMNASHDYHCRVNVPQGYQLGTRWAHPKFGYCPIGYFQLWNSVSDEWRGVKARSYSASHNSACRTDVQFALLWDRPKRAVISELIVAHLMSENLGLGANWNGRKTKQFGPDWRKSPGKSESGGAS